MGKGGCQKMRFVAVLNRLNREWLNKQRGSAKGAVFSKQPFFLISFPLQPGT